MKVHQFALGAGIALALLTLDVHAQQAASPASAAAVSAPAAATFPALDEATQKAASKSQRKADRMLEKAARNALAKAKSVDVTRINVRARSGVVTLLGSVPRQGQSETAAEVAQGVSGVMSVKNALTVKGIGQ